MTSSWELSFRHTIPMHQTIKHCQPVPPGRAIQPGAHLTNAFFHRNSNSMEISFCPHPVCNVAIAMKFCTWDDSYAVVAWTKFCSDTIFHNGVTLKPIFHQISNWMKVVCQMSPWLLDTCTNTCYLSNMYRPHNRAKHCLYILYYWCYLGVT